MNPKGHASSSSRANPRESVRKVNAVISLRSGTEIDNQVRNPNEPCMYPHQFFHNSYSYSSPSSSSSLETGSSSKPEDATDGVLNDSNPPPSLESPSKKEKLEEKDSSDSVKPPIDSSTEKVQMPLPPFPHMFKKKDQAHVEKMRETFSQVKINIPLLDAIQQCLHTLDF